MQHLPIIYNIQTLQNFILQRIVVSSISVLYNLQKLWHLKSKNEKERVNSNGWTNENEKFSYGMVSIMLLIFHLSAK